MRFLELPISVQNEIARQFSIPQNPNDVLVDNSGTAYELFGSSRVALSVNLENLHGGTLHTESVDRSNNI